MLQKIPTGCRKIDEFLEGGISSGSINLIFGEAETGKTSLATQCAVNCAARGYKTLFVDCDGTFSSMRLTQIASEQYERIAELVILMKPTTFREQAMVVDRLASYITKNFGLVVFDTVTTLYRLAVAESPSKAFELNRELNRQLAGLAQVAMTQKIVILMTSQVHSVFDEKPGDIEPVATRVLKFWADTVIAMRPTETSQIVKLILEKNPRNLSMTTYAVIDNAGIHEHTMR